MRYLLVVILAVFATVLAAQSTGPAFEVASIKRNTSEPIRITAHYRSHLPRKAR